MGIMAMQSVSDDKSSDEPERGPGAIFDVSDEQLIFYEESAEKSVAQEHLALPSAAPGEEGQTGDKTAPTSFLSMTYVLAIQVKIKKNVKKLLIISRPRVLTPGTTDSLKKGEAWFQDIMRNLVMSKCFVLLFHKNIESSIWVRREFRRATARVDTGPGRWRAS